MIITSPRRLAALALAAALAVAACGGGATSSPAQLRPAGPRRSRPAPARPSRPATSRSTGAGATFPAPLYQVWVEKFAGAVPERQDRLPGHRLGRRHQEHHRPDGRLRRLGRGHEGRRRSQPCRPARRSCTSRPPSAPSSSIYNLPGRDRPQPRRADRRRHLPRHDHEVERPDDRGAQQPARPCPTRTSSSSIAPTARAPRMPSRATSRRSATPGRTDPASGKDVKWPTGHRRQGQRRRRRRRSSRRRARSATSSSSTRPRRLSRRPSSRTPTAASCRVRSTGVTAAADAAAAELPGRLPARPRSSTAPGRTTYPIAAYTYLLVYVDQKDQAKGQALVAFIVLGADRRPGGRGRARATRRSRRPSRTRPSTSCTASRTGGAPIWP